MSGIDNTHLPVEGATDDPDLSSADEMVGRVITKVKGAGKPRRGTPEYVTWMQEHGGGRSRGITAEWLAVLPAVGTEVRHIETGQVFVVAGYKSEGKDRGYAVKVDPIDGGDQRNVVAWRLDWAEQSQ